MPNARTKMTTLVGHTLACPFRLADPVPILKNQYKLEEIKEALAHKLQRKQQELRASVGYELGSSK